MKTSRFIAGIRQKNNFVFTVEWGDGRMQDFRLSDLQRRCSCANCRDEETGRFIADPRTLSEEVRAFEIQSVGLYGLRIRFTSGCSAGIYSLEQLYDIS